MAPCTPTLLTTSSRLKISVKENGIYVITPDTLKQFCLDPSAITLSSFTLQNFDPNTATMIDIPVNMDPQGNIEFYGVGVNRNDYTSLNADYTETNIYWLVPGAQTLIPSKPPPPPTPSPTDPMTTLHVEQNNDYWPDMLNGNGYDHWFWELLTIASPIHNFSVSNYDTVSSQPVLISAFLQSKLQAQQLQMSFNGGPVVTQTPGWSTTSPYLFTMNPDINFPLVNGVNALQVNAGINTDSVFLNWFEIEYPAKAFNDQLIFHGDSSLSGSYSFSINGFTQNTIEVFDISDPKVPLVFSNPSVVGSSGGGYQLAFSDNFTVSVQNNYIALTSAQRKTPANITLANGVDLTQVTGPYDYVIITHENFLTNIQPLAIYRTSSGGGAHQVYIVKIGDVYDSYSGGILTPQAIKDFLKAAYSGWSTQYALLVGDASIDYKNYLGYGQENFVPTYLIEYSFGQTPSDYWYVQGPTNLPLMAIGRLPAKTGTEVDTMVNKIKSYEINAPPKLSPTWNKNAIFVAADDFNSGNVFEPKSDLLISGFSSTSIMITTIYDNVTAASIPNTQGQIINNINTGALITNYMGHGSVGVWGNGSNGNLSSIFFQASDVYSDLTNINQLTFLVTLDCLNGYFSGYGEGLFNSYTGQNNPLSLSESFMKSSTGGAVAAFSPTGQGYTIKHVGLAQELYLQILAPLNPPTLGLEIKVAETNVLLNASSDLETVSIFVLLGDPATQLALP